MGLTVTGPGGKLDVSWEPDGAIPPDGRFYPNPDPSAAYPLLELERAGIIRPVEPAITAYGPYGGRPASWKSPNHISTPCCARCG